MTLPLSHHLARPETETAKYGGPERQSEPPSKERPKGRTMWTLIITTALVTIALVVIYANLTSAAPTLQELPSPTYGVRDPQLARELTALFKHEIVGGNEITTLENGAEIFPAMLEAIRGAERSITMEIYVFWKGEICRRVAEALAERARAGVEVKVILDWVGAVPMESELAELMEQSGVQLEYYRPLSWYSIDRFNHRTHRRILVIDGRVGFTGGAGFGEEWSGDASEPGQFKDLHYRVRGPVVAQLQGAFAENWLEVRGEVLSGDAFFPRLEPVGETRAQVVTSAPGNGNERARDLHLRAITAAAESLDIMTPYFVPDELVLEALLDAARRGVKIRVMVPGRSTDSDAARFASRRVWGELIEAGIEIYEYHPEIFNHSKLVVVDGFMSLVGSTNFDSRSMRLNDEINLVVLDEEFGLEQLALFERDLGPAERVDYATWKRRPLRHKLLEPLALLIQGQL